MAGLIYDLVTPEITLTASTTRTLLQLTAPANHRLKILGYTVSFNEPVGDATPAVPIIVTLGTQSGGTGGSAVTAVKRGAVSEAVLTTAVHTMSAAATTTAIEKHYVNAQTGIAVIFPMGQEIAVAGATLFGVDITTGTISTAVLKVIIKLTVEE
jgi:hypothetical protein